MRPLVFCKKKFFLPNLISLWHAKYTSFLCGCVLTEYTWFHKHKTILLRLSSLELFSIWLNSTKFYEFQCMFMQICTYQEEYATYQTFYTEHRSPLTDFSLEVLWEMTCWWTVKNCNESFVCALYNRIYSYSLLPIFHSVNFLFRDLCRFQCWEIAVNMKYHYIDW